MVAGERALSCLKLVLIDCAVTQQRCVNISFRTLAISHDVLLWSLSLSISAKTCDARAWSLSEVSYTPSPINLSLEADELVPIEQAVCIFVDRLEKQRHALLFLLVPWVLGLAGSLVLFLARRSSSKDQQQEGAD